jgi:glyoxylase-like metal-dependent hydrolase (beta-lactamase superfamily II)
MLEVSPVRAFSDNYIWLIRAPGDPAGAAVVDPGDARPAEDALDREGLRLSALFEGTPAQMSASPDRSAQRHARGKP